MAEAPPSFFCPITYELMVDPGVSRPFDMATGVACSAHRIATLLALLVVLSRCLLCLSCCVVVGLCRSSHDRGWTLIRETCDRALAPRSRHLPQDWGAAPVHGAHRGPLSPERHRGVAAGQLQAHPPERADLPRSTRPDRRRVVQAGFQGTSHPVPHPVTHQVPHPMPHPMIRHVSLLTTASRLPSVSRGPRGLQPSLRFRFGMATLPLRPPRCSNWESTPASSPSSGSASRRRHPAPM